MPQQLDSNHARELVKSFALGLTVAPHIADQAETPSWVVSVSYDAPSHGRVNRFTTAGVLVGPRHVLTCGQLFEDALMQHLPDEPRVAQRKFFVRVGTTVLGSGEMRSVKQVETAGFVPIGNPGHEHETEVNDLAILFLDDDVAAAPITIGTAPVVRGDAVSFFGWPDGDAGSGELTQINTTVIEPNASASELGGEDEFCAANIAGDGQLRRGYAGGPVIRIPADSTIDDAELVGLASRAAPNPSDDMPPPAVVVDIAGRHRQFVLDCLAETV